MEIPATGMRYCRKNQVFEYIERSEPARPVVPPQQPAQTDFSSEYSEENADKDAYTNSRFRIKEIRVKLSPPAAHVVSAAAVPVDPSAGDVMTHADDGVADDLVQHPDESSAELAADESDEDADRFDETRLQIDAAEAALRVDDGRWQMSLAGLNRLADIAECGVDGACAVKPHMPVAHHRISELVRGPRSHACRAACQAAARLFASVRDTRRPGFDDASAALLAKCADANRFVRGAARAALDSLVTHVSPYQAVRALCAAGSAPHCARSDSVRAELARLLAAAAALLGPALVLGPAANRATRRRLLAHMVRYLEDRSPEVRGYAGRMLEGLRDAEGFEAALADCELCLPRSSKMLRRNKI